MSWNKMYKNNLPKLYNCLVKNYKNNNFKLKFIYPKPEKLRSKKDYQHYTNLYLDALTFPEYHYLYRETQVRK